MTTTAFRIDSKNIARMGSDSRVSWVTNDGYVAKVFDSPHYFKIANIGGALFGFAGANVIYKNFLSSYNDVLKDSNKVLDTLVAVAHYHKVQFTILRYDGELREFANSPPQNGRDEIFLDSGSPALGVKHYAIGSGHGSKMYKKNKINERVCFPIRKIIGANNRVLQKGRFAHIRAKVGKENFTQDESIEIFNACHIAGGDIFTGGEVRVMELAKSVTTQEVATEQVKHLERFDADAKSQGYVCASPIYAQKEIEQLQRLNIAPVRSGGVDPEIRNSDLFERFSKAVQDID